MRRKFTMYGPPRWVFSPLVACLVLCLLSASGRPQDDPTIPTLRVYTNLLQIPTLVLNWQHKPIPNLAESRFRISIDSGPKSRVTHARVEGEDPIALAVLVDAFYLPDSMKSRLPTAVAGLVPNSLRPGDSVSLYDLNCKLSRAVVARPVTAAELERSAGLILGEPKETRKSHERDSCQQHWNLLDSIAAAVQALQNEPGRRVLLVISDGQDRGSRTTWDAVRAYASEKGVAIFGMLASSASGVVLRGPRGMPAVSTASDATNMPELCESTGGIMLGDSDASTATRLRDFLALVRARYIIEFPKPDADAGSHRLEVSVEKLNAFIRPAGASVPVGDPELAKDPNTIISGSENAPAVGTKRPKQ